MNKKIIVGLHVFCHDANISTYDLETKKFNYLKFERISGIKHESHSNLTDWLKYLDYLGYSKDNILHISLNNADKTFNDLSGKVDQNNWHITDHHINHNLSYKLSNSFVIDGVGSNLESTSIVKNNFTINRLLRKNNPGLGKTLNVCYNNFFPNQPSHPEDGSGKIMALAAFGKRIDNLFKKEEFNLEMVDKGYFFRNYGSKSFTEKANFVHTLHEYYFDFYKKYLSNYFSTDEAFSLVGGVGHNIITNTKLKNLYPNLEAVPHCGDEGCSIGALRTLLRDWYDEDLEIDFDNLHQSDEDFGEASLPTIKKVAEYLAQGKIVLWGQGYGEIGPRALGNRSILMNPGIKDAKEQINLKIKNREWYRPYGASVLKSNYKDFFDLKWESPYMLYQAKVKNPDVFASITHGDGTCRIQTVSNRKRPYYELLQEFEKLTGYPILLNTSLNSPGKPIVGTKKQARIMFDNSQADVLIIGNEILKK